MHKKLKAVEVVSNKLWITYDDKGTKTGTLNQYEKDGTSCFCWFRTYKNDQRWYSVEDAADKFSFEEKAAVSSWHDQHVLGYPVIKIETFKVQERDNLPCFTKTPSSKVFFAAGYYGIKFENGGWLDSFCPKLATLRKYEYIGPFKTETDMTIAIQRKKHRNE